MQFLVKYQTLESTKIVKIVLSRYLFELWRYVWRPLVTQQWSLNIPFPSTMFFLFIEGRGGRDGRVKRKREKAPSRGEKAEVYLRRFSYKPEVWFQSRSWLSPLLWHLSASCTSLSYWFASLLTVCTFKMFSALFSNEQIATHAHTEMPGNWMRNEKRLLFVASVCCL